MLKVTTRDRRVAVGLVDDRTGALLVSYNTVPEASRHCDVLQQIGQFAGREWSAEQLNAAVCDASETLYSTRKFGHVNNP